MKNYTFQPGDKVVRVHSGSKCTVVQEMPEISRVVVSYSPFPGDGNSKSAYVLVETKNLAPEPSKRYVVEFREVKEGNRFLTYSGTQDDPIGEIQRATSGGKHAHWAIGEKRWVVVIEQD